VSNQPKEKVMTKWAQAIKLAKHYKAIGQTDIYLDRDSEEKPWSFVTAANPGGAIRMGSQISCEFRAAHAPSGLSFRWYVDLEPRDADGSGELQIDVDALREILRKLPEKPARQFRKQLAQLAIDCKKQSDEWLNTATRLASRAREISGV